MLDESQVRRAVKALLKHVEITRGQKTKATKKKELLDDDSFVSLVIALKRIPGKSSFSNPHRIPLVHSLYQIGETEVCLITKDPQKEFKELIAEKGVPGIAKVIGITKLRANYKSYEQRRQLSASYDLFLADDRVVRLLPGLLGKPFFTKKRHPIGINMKRQNLKDEVLRAIDATYLYLGQGPCSAVKIGRTNFSSEQIVENIMASIAHAVAHVPQKWKNVQSVHIKTPDSLALPVFNSLPTTDRIPKITPSGVRTPAETESTDNEEDQKPNKTAKGKPRSNTAKSGSAQVRTSAKTESTESKEKPAPPAKKPKGTPRPNSKLDSSKSATPQAGKGQKAVAVGCPATATAAKKPGMASTSQAGAGTPAAATSKKKPAAANDSTVKTISKKTGKLAVPQDKGKLAVAKDSDSTAEAVPEWISTGGRAAAAAATSKKSKRDSTAPLGARISKQLPTKKKVKT